MTGRAASRPRHLASHALRADEAVVGLSEHLCARVGCGDCIERLEPSRPRCGTGLGEGQDIVTIDVSDALGPVRSHVFEVDYILGGFDALRVMSTQSAARGL